SLQRQASLRIVCGLRVQKVELERTVRHSPAKSNTFVAGPSLSGRRRGNEAYSFLSGLSLLTSTPTFSTLFTGRRRGNESHSLLSVLSLLTSTPTLSTLFTGRRRGNESHSLL